MFHSISATRLCDRDIERFRGGGHLQLSIAGIGEFRAGIGSIAAVDGYLSISPTWIDNQCTRDIRLVEDLLLGMPISLAGFDVTLVGPAKTSLLNTDRKGGTHILMRLLTAAASEQSSAWT